MKVISLQRSSTDNLEKFELEPWEAEKYVEVSEQSSSYGHKSKFSFLINKWNDMVLLDLENSLKKL